MRFPASDAGASRSSRAPPEGRYRATVWEDGATPDEIRSSVRNVSRDDALTLRLAAAGGAAVLLERP